MQMLRKTGLLLSAAVLFSGCDLFSTREFFSKPSEIRSLAGMSKAKDSVAYTVRQSLWNPSTHALVKELSRQRMIFTLVGDSLDGTDTLKVLSLRIIDDSTGILMEKSVRLVRFSRDGIRLEAPAANGGVRYFPLKAGAVSGAQADSAGADNAAFALPGLLAQGWSEIGALGVFQVRRQQTSVDTLKYQGHLEEAWGIHESIFDGDSLIAVGDYRYGVSGLLQADLVWAGFGWRDGNGSKLGGTEVHRALVRQ